MLHRGEEFETRVSKSRARLHLQVKKSATSFYSLPDHGAGHRGRVFRRLLDEAVALVRQGRIPSVPEVRSKRRGFPRHGLSLFPVR